jgi:glycosyltransferase involved in cell wall biosynthesis
MAKREFYLDILLLAPQPFYWERGTPIAVDLVLRGLSERGERVDVLTYHIGKEMRYEGVQIHRIRKIPFIKEVSPGFSMKKVLCDLVMFVQVFPLVLRKRYQIIHAVEESVYIALLLKFFFKIPYVYDMDSSLAQQMIERHPRLFRPFSFLLNYFEGLAIRNARAVVPVCDALSWDVERHNPVKVLVLHDVSLLGTSERTRGEDLRSRLGIEGPIMMYVGNLEGYQGIDLLLESFTLTLKKTKQANLVIIGGKGGDIQKYQARARQLGIDNRVHFLGPQPVEHLSVYLAQADILVSPRVKGRNTPMKIYSYMDSGKALLATKLPTHTQVLNEEVALLAEPSARDFSNGVLHLLEDKNLRQKLGKAAKQLIAERHTITIFRENLNALYDWLGAEMGQKCP